MSLQLQKKLSLVAIAASIATAAFAATGVDWRWAWASGNLTPLLMAYIITVALTVAPYGLYLLYVPQSSAGSKLQLALLGLLIAISASLHGYWLLIGARTNGWNFLIVPVLQFAYLLFGVPAIIRLAAIARRTRPSDYGT